ncbi:MAG: hypothetical protein ACRDF6_14340, partial [bacterium]
SLRGAITNANANPGADQIQFALGTGTPVINVGSTGLGGLPGITEAVTIIGNSGGATRIQLNGLAAGTVDGLRILGGATNVTIRSLVISSFGGDGFEILASAGQGTIIRNCYIGTNATGAGDLGNSFDGIRINGGTGHFIGGVAPGFADRNVISGNGAHGIEIASTATGGVAVAFIAANYIGLNALGNTVIPNEGDGLHIASTGDPACIGGNLSSGNCVFASGATNVISGNGSDGIEISRLSNGHRIWVNRIGTNATGTVDAGNVGAGLRVEQRQSYPRQHRFR